jgi:hypothetical protein
MNLMMKLPPRRIGAAPVAPESLSPAFAQAQTDFQNQVVAVIAAGDTYLAAGETAQAIATYKAAGMAGATSVGPEIDLLGYPSASQPWTQQAWRINALLQATNVAADAQAYVKNIQLRYSTALSAAAFAATAPPPSPPTLGASQVAWAAVVAAGLAAAWVRWS